jgi:hypothetical protein
MDMKFHHGDTEAQRKPFENKNMDLKHEMNRHAGFFI